MAVVERNKTDWKEKLPEFHTDEIILDICRERERCTDRPSKDPHICDTFIWRHQAATEKSLERSYIEIHLTRAYIYRIEIEEQKLQPNQIEIESRVTPHLNKNDCVVIIEPRPVKEVALEYASAFLDAFNFITVDIAPPIISSKLLSIYCENLTIRGTWDNENKNLVGKWLEKCKDASKSVNIITGSTCAKISFSPRLEKTGQLSIQGFTDIGQEDLYNFNGTRINVEGSVADWITGFGLTHVLQKWIKFGVTTHREMKLIGVLETNFTERIYDLLKVTHLIESDYDREMNVLKVNHNFGKFILHIRSSSNWLHAWIEKVMVDETVKKLETTKKSTPKKNK